MSDFEDQLRAALRRHDPPPGFEDRVIERLRRERAVPIRRSRPAWKLAWAAGAIAAGLTVVSLSVSSYQHMQEERAGKQAALALKIAAEKLNLARDRALKQTARKDY